MTDLPRIGRPATAALQAAGITTLEAALALDDDALLGLHGFGPKALQILRDAAATSTTTTKKKKPTKKKPAKKKPAKKKPAKKPAAKKKKTTAQKKR